MSETINNLPANNMQTIRTVRPWVRYFARLLDGLIVCYTVGVIIGVVDICINNFNNTQVPNIITSFTDTHPQLADILLSSLYLIFIEPLLLSYYGTTFGKWLLRIKVYNQDGHKLDYLTSLRRSLYVYIYGLGLYIPIISLFTLISAYSSLTKKWITTWDRKYNIVVHHQKIGIVRIIIMILLILFTVLQAIYFRFGK